MSFDVQVGDWVMTGPAAGQANLFQKGILLTGAKHTHDELVCLDMGGKLCVGSAESPHFKLVPFEERLRECDRRERVMTVCRWTDFCEIERASAHGSKDAEWIRGERFQSYQIEVNVCLRLMARLRIPYDWRGIESHAWNVVRSRIRPLRIFGKLAAHREYAVYCTEGVFEVVSVTLRDLRELVRRQPLVSPIHAERLLREGYLSVVADWGLASSLGL